MPHHDSYTNNNNSNNINNHNESKQPQISASESELTEGTLQAPFIYPNVEVSSTTLGVPISGHMEHHIIGEGVNESRDSTYAPHYYHGVPYYEYQDYQMIVTAEVQEDDDISSVNPSLTNQLPTPLSQSTPKVASLSHDRKCCISIVGLVILITLFALVIIALVLGLSLGFTLSKSNVKSTTLENDLLGISTLRIEGYANVKLYESSRTDMFVRVDSKKNVNPYLLPDSSDPSILVLGSDSSNLKDSVTYNIFLPDNSKTATLALHALLVQGSITGVSSRDIELRSIDITCNRGYINLRRFRTQKHLNLASQSGNIIINDISTLGNITVTSVDGQIRAEMINSEQSILVNTHTGDIRIVSVKTLFSLEVRSHFGEIFTANAEVRDHLSVAAESGLANIHVKRIDGHLYLNKHEGHAQLSVDQLGDSIHAESTSGKLNVVVQNFEGFFDLSSESGKTKVESSKDNITFTQQTTNRKTGIVGIGLQRIRLNSKSGNVFLSF